MSLKPSFGKDSVQEAMLLADAPRIYIEATVMLLEEVGTQVQNLTLLLIMSF